MSAFSLIISIVPHDKGEKLTKAAVESGSGGGTVLMGRSLAKSNLGAILGGGETTKDLIYMVVSEEKKSEIMRAIFTATEHEKSNFGEIFTLNVDNLMKAGVIYGETQSEKSEGGEKMNKDNAAVVEPVETTKNKGHFDVSTSLNNHRLNDQSRDMITVIVNKGFADDVMFAARKAGATGGTVITARGTAREDDEKFFGVHIVPEKDMLVIVVEHEKKAEVLAAIQDVKCLKEPGMGIAFSSPVEEFATLGKKK